MDVETEFDPHLKIKEEKELQIDDDGQWLPTKFEDVENEYYQDSWDDCNQICVKSESELESYTIKYMDESEDNMDYEDDESDEYAEWEKGDESFNYSNECGNTSNGIETNCFEDFDYSESQNSSQDAVSQLELNRWITINFVECECPICSKRFSNYREIKLHIEQKHKDSIEETEKNFFVGSDNSGVCKKCNMEISTKTSRYLHSIKHDGDDSKLEINICKLCDFKTKSFFVQKHILEEHPQAVKKFKTSGTLRNKKCPLCSYSYKIRREIWYHFMDKHPLECKSKVSYDCHLCKHDAFNNEECFLQHLTAKHDLNSWKVLNFRKIVDDKELFACTECGSLFKNEKFKLVRHFLNHEGNSFWSCRFCYKKQRFHKTPLRHVCLPLIQFYKSHYNETNDIKVNSGQVENEWQIKNLQEFEKYIAHVCPFCNKEFGKMLKWQKHLKIVHKIETLEGLEMKVIANDKNKLCCGFCHTVVSNSTEKLQAHRFQHLPYKPYRCTLCSSTLNSFKVAVNHVLKRCKDEDDRNFIKNVLIRKADGPNPDIRSVLEMHCTLCNHKKFYDIKSIFKHYEDDHNNFEDMYVKNTDNSRTCKICHKQFVQHDRNPCVLHLLNHLDEKPFKCTLCLQTYSTFKSINQHLVSRHNAKYLPRHSYEKNAKKSDFFQNKAKDTLPQNVPQLAMSTIKTHVLNEFAEYISFVCPECNEGITSQQNWYTHITTKHNFFDESNIYIKDDNGSFKCTTCKIKLDIRKTQQQKHKLTHMPYKSFMCTLCYARCNSLGVLYGHFRRKHFAKGSFGCPICPDVLETSHQRTEHLTDKHPRNEWPATICSICYTVLSSKYSLRTHMITHDADRFKYTCEICNSKIIELKDFKLHMERHKKRGEVLEKLSDDVNSRCVKQNCQSKKCNETQNCAIFDKHQYLPEEEENDFLNKKQTNRQNILTKKKNIFSQYDDDIGQNKYSKNDRKMTNKRKTATNSLETKKKRN